MQSDAHQRTRIKVPRGYPRAGRYGRVIDETDAMVRVLVPRPRRILSSRIVPDAIVEIAKRDICHAR